VAKSHNQSSRDVPDPSERAGHGLSLAIDRPSRGLERPNWPSIPALGERAVMQSFTASAINSAAYLRRLARLPPAQRVSMCTLRPSVQPNCCSSCRNAATSACPWASSTLVPLSTPMRRMTDARAASGHVAATPASADTNCRLPMSNAI